MSLRFLDYFISNPQILRLVRVLEISRVLDSRPQSSPPLKFLTTIPLLSVLKVPIHSINMDIVQQMVNKALKDLYLLSDDTTVDHKFEEQDAKQNFQWDSLILPKNKEFSVHYIFKQRVLKAKDFTPNPYVRSVCLESLCSPLVEELIGAVSTCYGATLQLFALSHCVPWAPEIHFSDLSAFAANCKRLTHFISTQELPAAALLSLTENSATIEEVMVVAQMSEEIISIIPAMSEHLRKPWKTHSSPATFSCSFCGLSFLIDEYTLRGFG
jgi:hypothetical protein